MINTINEFIDEFGNSFYAQWLYSIRDPRVKARIIMQVDKMQLGLFGDSRPIGHGLSELRIHYGPGFRVYYGKVATHHYLLLCGGTKSTQSKDIRLAHSYWQDYEQQSRKRS